MNAVVVHVHHQSSVGTGHRGASRPDSAVDARAARPRWPSPQRPPAHRDGSPPGTRRSSALRRPAGRSPRRPSAAAATATRLPGSRPGRQARALRSSLGDQALARHRPDDGDGASARPARRLPHRAQPIVGTGGLVARRYVKVATTTALGLTVADREHLPPAPRLPRRRRYPPPVVDAAHRRRRRLRQRPHRQRHRRPAGCSSVGGSPVTGASAGSREHVAARPAGASAIRRLDGRDLARAQHHPGSARRRPQGAVRHVPGQPPRLADGHHVGRPALPLSVCRRAHGQRAVPPVARGPTRTRPQGSTGLAFQYFPKHRPRRHAGTVDFTRRGWLHATPTGSGQQLAHLRRHQRQQPGQPQRGDPADVAHRWDYPLKPFHLSHVSFCDHPYPCSWNPDKPFSWQANRNQNATQVFFFVNNWHDHLRAAPIGFTEAAGNFQV